MKTSAPALRLRGVCKSFGVVPALREMDFDLLAGEIHGIVGENGAGKSTLLRIIAGAERADAGEMQLLERGYAPQDPRDARKGGVVVVNQEPSIADSRTVAENINLGREIASYGVIDRASQNRVAANALKAIGADHLVNPAQRASTLTSGTRQMVEIARAFVTRPAVLLLDEPTSSLSRSEADQLWRAVRILADDGVAVALVSHRLDEVRRVATRATVLRDGRVVACDLLSVLDDDALVSAMSGRALLEGSALWTARTAGAICHESGGIVLRAGEILGIGGLVGSGRSRWLRELARETGAPRVSEDRRGEGLAQNLSIAENLTLPILSRLGKWGVVRAEKQASITHKWKDALSIKCLGPWQRISELSGGNQQKVAIARVLEQSSAIVLVDEPTRGIDVTAKAAIHEILRRASSDGHSIVVVSSDTRELLALCDRIAVMWRGALGRARPTSEWTEHAIVDEALRGASVESAA